MDKLAQTKLTHSEYCTYIATPRNPGIQTVNHIAPMKSATLTSTLSIISLSLCPLILAHNPAGRNKV